MRYTTLIQLPARKRFWRSPPAIRTSGSSTPSGITASFTRRRKASIPISTLLPTRVRSTRSRWMMSNPAIRPEGRHRAVRPILARRRLRRPAIRAGREIEAARAQAQMAQAHAATAVEQFRADYPTQALKFDYTYHNESPFDVSAIYHDDKFTYIKSSAAEKFSIYELKDGKPDLITFQLKRWHLRHPHGCRSRLPRNRQAQARLSTEGAVGDMLTDEKQTTALPEPQPAAPVSENTSDLRDKRVRPEGVVPKPGAGIRRGRTRGAHPDGRDVLGRTTPSPLQKRPRPARWPRPRT